MTTPKKRVVLDRLVRQRHAIPFDVWIEKYGRTEDPKGDRYEGAEPMVYARCTCPTYERCQGWVLTYADSLAPWEAPIPDAEREELGLPKWEGEYQRAYGSVPIIR